MHEWLYHTSDLRNKSLEDMNFLNETFNSKNNKELS
jgi:hypothetical protein